MKKILILSLSSFLFLLGFFVYDLLRFSDSKLHVVFCNVGQGDGIFVRTPRGNDIVLDGGPNDSILSCISSHVPFWDRRIELMFLSHPHLDHFLGLISVIQRYTVLAFVSEALANKTASFQELMSEIHKKQIPERLVLASDRFKTADNVIFRIVGPSKEFLHKTSPEGIIGENKEFASLETLIKYGNFSVLLTGDSQAAELQEAVDNGLIPKDGVKILQVPHHGSKTGLNPAVIEALNPKIAVISVGKNKYGHPSQEVLKLLNDHKVKILRTDQKGDIEIISDGKEIEIKTKTK